MGWIRGYQEPLAAWSQMLEAVATTLTYARAHGYHSLAKQELQAELSCFLAQPETPACRVSERLLAFERSRHLPRQAFSPSRRHPAYLAGRALSPPWGQC